MVFTMVIELVKKTENRNGEKMERTENNLGYKPYKPCKDQCCVELAFELMDRLEKPETNDFYQIMELWLVERNAAQGWSFNGYPVQLLRAVVCDHELAYQAISESIYEDSRKYNEDYYYEMKADLESIEKRYFSDNEIESMIDEGTEELWSNDMCELDVVIDMLYDQLSDIVYDNE